MMEKTIQKRPVTQEVLQEFIVLRDRLETRLVSTSFALIIILKTFICKCINKIRWCF